MECFLATQPTVQHKDSLEFFFPRKRSLFLHGD